jgi:hypothetical protein
MQADLLNNVAMCALNTRVRRLWSLWNRRVGGGLSCLHSPLPWCARACVPRAQEPASALFHANEALRLAPVRRRQVPVRRRGG